MTHRKAIAWSCAGFTVVAAGSLLGSAAIAEHVRQGAKIFTTDLQGEVEVPPGDLDGTGTFTLFVNPGQKRVCYELTLAGIDAPTAAHIHKAPAGAAAPPAIPLPTPPLGSSSACVDVTSRVAAQIIAKPEQYYYNVHNATFPAGALRGQLARAPHH